MSQLIAIASGKGGVGKTLITAALSVLLQRRGHRVLAADATWACATSTCSSVWTGPSITMPPRLRGGNACPARLC